MASRPVVPTVSRPWRWAVLGAAFLSGLQLSTATAQQVPAPKTVVTGLAFPTGIAFGPDGTMYVNERSGRVRVVRKGELESQPLAEIGTSTSGEQGLLGITVAPDLKRDAAVYVFASDETGGENRVYRVPLDGSGAQLIISGLPASSYHNGGGVAFIDDGSLLVTNGERHEAEIAQDPQALGGKVYRYTAAGRVPRDNPFGDSPAYAIGLRNPFGLAIDPISGAPFVTENGPSSHDEVNRIEAGANYGWPVTSGPAPGAPPGLVGTYHDPLLDYPDIIVPTGLAFADPVNARPEFAGDLFFGAYSEGSIHRVRLDADRRTALSDEIFLETPEPVALAWGPEGLYYSTPDAVKVVPIARAGSSATDPTTEADERSPEAAVPQPLSEPVSGGVPWTLLVPMVAVIGAALILLSRRYM
ncbi:MAG: sorbosone dehydrogenase family protein [Actinomycetota bacterium]